MSVPLATIRRLLLVVCTAALGLSAPARAQRLDVDPFVALTVTPDEHFASFGIGAGGDASTTVLTGRWTREISKQAAMVQRFDPAGARIGGFVRVDDGLDVGSVEIEPGPNGGFIAFWRDREDGRVRARLLDQTGAPTTPSFVFSSSYVLRRSGAAFGGGAAIVWGDADTLWVRPYDAAGTALGPATLVANVPPYGVSRIGVAATGDGGFVVAWDESGRVRGRLYDSAGAPRDVPVDLADELEMRVVAGNPLGGFAIVGARVTDTHARPAGVWVRRFDANGTPTAPPDLVDAIDATTSFVTSVGAAFDPAGRLYVTWDTSSYAVPSRGRAYDPAGRPLHPPFSLTDDEEVAAQDLVARPDGRFVESWRKFNDLGLRVRALCVPPAHVGCGDGAVEAPCEQCDAGPANSDTTPDACRTTCAAPACGDGVIDHGESCDDGNRRGCDGCDTSCRAEAGWVCGDGVVSGDCAEECDDGPGSDDLLPDACRTDCRRAHCGDGVLDAGEACDDGNTTSCDGCSGACVAELGLVCGDGIPELHCGEQCDDGNAIVGDGCTEPCRLERIPGGGSPATDCYATWIVDNPTNVPLYDKSGAVSGVQVCRDGDPRCDFDAAPGACAFHVRVCANGAGFPACRPGERLARWELRAPSVAQAAKRPSLAAVRAAFAPVPGAIVGATAADVCSETLVVPVSMRAGGGGTRPGALVLKAFASLYDGTRDGDRLKLVCVP